TEHRNPEGRTYWFNATTKQSVWEKPDVLKTPFEKALSETKWKEYFSGGRKYYYNTESKESKWDMPDELLLLLEKVEKEKSNQAVVPAAQVPPTTPVSSATPAPLNQGNGDARYAGALVPSGVGGAVVVPGSSAIPPVRPNIGEDPVIPHNGFTTYEDGEKAFLHLLRKAGVDATWTWDQTMRAIITDPLYKALNSLAEKKSVYQKYTTSLKQKEQEEREARLAKLRPAVRNMLKGNPAVFHYTTFPTADRLFAQHPIWQQARIEAERKLIFEEYVNELRQREVQEARNSRSRSISKVNQLFKQLGVNVITRWRTAQRMLFDSDEWVNDPELHKLPTLDILLAFEDYARMIEREYEEQSRRQQVEKTRRERKAREVFKELIQELADAGHIKARTKWKEIYPLIKDDIRYTDILGNPGSNPIELFWDKIDALDQLLDGKIEIDKESVKPAEFSVQPETTEQEFLNVVKADSELTDEDLIEIFKTMQAAAVKKRADERRRTERRLRHLQDDLRYALKKLPQPLDVSLDYDQALPLICDLPEFKALDDEESRRSAFVKFVKRQKERMRETAGSEDGSTTSRRRKEPGHSKDASRDVPDRVEPKSPGHRKDSERDKDRRSRHRHDDYDDHYERDYDRDYRDDYRRHERRKRDREVRDWDDPKDTGRDWDDDHPRSQSSQDAHAGSRGVSVYRDDPPRGDKYDVDDRAEKRARHDREPAPAQPPVPPVREDTPEEGEI
ncbi:hypothetical protein FISHEDRAFT_41666, partial [Fistulina hepatica ATCC 64428]